MGGDPDDREGRAYLDKCSPLNFLDQVKRPLLLCHGQKDHIVAERESRQIYDRMKENGCEVNYLLFPDEGHGFAKFPNQIHFLTLAEKFLSEHLGGRCVPSNPKILSESSGIIHQ